MTQEGPPTPCENCDFIFAIKLPDGTITTACSGQLLDLDEKACYKFPDPNARPIVFGAYTEYVGGSLGKLAICLSYDMPDVDEVEVLIEGRFRKLDLRKWRGD